MGSLVLRGGIRRRECGWSEGEVGGLGRLRVWMGKLRVLQITRRVGIHEDPAYDLEGAQVGLKILKDHNHSIIIGILPYYLNSNWNLLTARTRF